MSKAIKGPKKSGPDPAIAAQAAANAKAAAAKKLADEQQAEALRKAKASQGRSSLGNPGGDDTAARVGKTTLGA
jgi:hypothetical protein